MNDNSTTRKTVLAVDTYPKSGGTMVIDVQEYHVLKSEISRLRAELEMAEFEAKRYSDILDSTRLVRDILAIERDEARELARKYYQLWHTAESELLKRVNSDK